MILTFYDRNPSTRFHQAGTTQAASQTDSPYLSAFGGPEKAELLVDGPKDELLDLVNLLRCGVTVRDGQGEPVWWGYIEEVQVELEEVVVRYHWRTWLTGSAFNMITHPRILYPGTAT